MLLSSTFIVCAIAMQYAVPIFFIALRMALTAILLFGYLIFSKKSCVINYEDRWLICVLGIIHIFIPFVGELYALQDSAAAAKVSLVWSLSPFFTALAAWLLYSERLTRLKIIGLVLGCIGMFPVLIYTGSGLSRLFFHVGFADIMLLCAVVSAAFAWNLFKELIHKGYSPLVLNAWSMSIGSTVSGAVSLVTEASNVILVSNWLITFVCLLFLVIIGGIICYNLYGYLLRFYTATFLSFACCVLIPCFTALLQKFFFSQSVSLIFIVSLCITISGLIIFYNEELRKTRN
jgi:drug/metabolite transporter (DMT)-like permease